MVHSRICIRNPACLLPPSDYSNHEHEANHIIVTVLITVNQQNVDMVMVLKPSV